MAKKTPRKKKRAQRRVSAKEVLIFAVLGLAAILIAGIAHLAGLDGNRAETALRMSEVMSANTATALPGADGWPDWIEIENVSDAPAALTGCALVRESEPSRAFAFPGGTLAAGGRVVVLADGSDGASDGAYHAPFRLSSAGETIRCWMLPETRWIGWRSLRWAKIRSIAGTTAARGRGAPRPRPASQTASRARPKSPKPPPSCAARWRSPRS